jgi:hypothetical protein
VANSQDGIHTHLSDTLIAHGARLPARKVCKRYQVTARTLARWLDDERMKFPRPLVINRRRYFALADLLAWESRRV